MHPNKFMLAHVAFALVLAHDIRTQITARKEHKQDLETNAHIVANAVIMGSDYENKLNASKKQIEYLVGLLNENDVTIDEFDLIALNFHNQ